MAGRTYRYMSEEPLYPFGFGLSYSRFEYSELKLEKENIQAGESLAVQVTVQNSGDKEASEITQFYLSDLEASTIVPIHHLIGFKRIKLTSGAKQKVDFDITPDMIHSSMTMGKNP